VLAAVVQGWDLGYNSSFKLKGDISHESDSQAWIEPAEDALADGRS
jgi:hypothetical protein